MNEETTITEPKPKRARKAKNATPRTRKPLSDAELAIKKRYKAEMDAHRASLKSGAILRRILALLPKLTEADTGSVNTATAPKSKLP